MTQNLIKERLEELLGYLKITHKEDGVNYCLLNGYQMDRITEALQTLIDAKTAHTRRSLHPSELTDDEFDALANSSMPPTPPEKSE